MIRKPQNLLGCDRGASVIEFALAAPFIATLLLGMIEVSRAYSDRLMLEQAAQRTIEKVQQQRAVSSDYSSLRDEAAAAASVSRNNVVVRQWLECTPTDGAGNPTGSPVSQGENSLTNQCPNGTDIPSRYVTVAITKTFTPVVGARYLGANDDGSYTLAGEAGVRIQ